jgi:integrase
MATVNFLYRSKRDNAPLTLRLLFRHDNIDYVFGCRTDIHVDKSVFESLRSKSRDAHVRHQQTELLNLLNPLHQYVISSFNKTSPDEVTKEWLKDVVSEYHNPEPEKDERVAHWINKIIEGANTRENAKGGIGLSKGRIATWKRLLTLFKEYSKSKNYKIHQMTVSRFKDFRNWLINDMEYSATYATKKLSDLKTAIREAKGEGIEVSSDFDKLPTKQTSAYDDDMDVITLTEDEIERIERLDLDNDALINARKWLILACYTGQRGEVLTKRLNEESFVKRGKDMVIRIVQKKGNKPVQIPVLPKVKEIYEDELPYSVSTQKLNQHFKTLGREAKIEQMVMGRLEEYDNPKGKRGVKKLREKWEYISTHIGRRTFATNHYGEIPTPIIMAVTGHKKESTFLRYINKSDDSHIDTFLDYYQKKELKERKEPQLEIVKTKSNNE